MLPVTNMNDTNGRGYLVLNNAFTEKLNYWAGWFTSLKYVMAIKQAFVMLMPVIIVGAFGVLISNMVMGTQSGLAAFETFAFLAEYRPIMGQINYATLNFLTIGAIFMIGLELGKLNGQVNAYSGLLAVICFVAVIPTTYEVVVAGEAFEVSNVIARQYTDTKGLFLGMFIAILSVEVYSKLLKVNALQIKMPDSVPPNVANSFSALLPSIITVTAIATFGFTFYEISGMTLYDATYAAIQRPLEGAIQSLPGVLLLMFLAQVFWVVGIHGNQMIKPLREPLLLGAIAANMTAYENGEEIPNIITMPFWDIYMSIGGSGVTIGLLVAVFLVCKKRKDMREIAKLSVGPGAFNINEPVVFGMPIMLNPILAIPFIITPLITGMIGYYATAIGFAGKAVVMIPWTCPPILSSWLATGGSLGAVATQIACIITSILIYLPFVKVCENQFKEQLDNLENEQQTETKEAVA